MAFGLRSPYCAIRRELGLEAADRLHRGGQESLSGEGHRHLIDALALLTDRHPTAHLAIGGRGDLEDALRCQARARGIENRVHLLGLRADIPAVLRAADLFVLPSLSEGLPLALLEAMFTGCPIVATDVGDVRVALAQGEAGPLVTPGSPDALAGAIDQLLSDRLRASELGERASRHASAVHGIDQMVRRYRSVYENLLGSAASQRQPHSSAVRLPNDPEIPGRTWRTWSRCGHASDVALGHDRGRRAWGS
jgi:glycosyltransferase involved in cell wall biosynthesis